MQPRFHTVRGIPIVLEPGTGPRARIYSVCLGHVVLAILADTGESETMVSCCAHDSDLDITVTGSNHDMRIQLALEELIDKLFAQSKLKATQLGLLAVPVLPGFGRGKGAV